MSGSTLLMSDIWYELNIKKGDGTRIIWFQTEKAQWVENNILPVGRFLFIHASLADKEFLRPPYVLFYMTDFKRTEPTRPGTEWEYVPAEIDIAERLDPLWKTCTAFKTPFTWDILKDDFGNSIREINYR